MVEFFNWLISPVGSAVAGWGGVVISIIGFVATYRAAQASKRAAEKALTAVSNLDILQNLKEAVDILGQIKGLHNDNVGPRVISMYYSLLRKLLLPLTEPEDVVSDDDRLLLNAVVLHAKLAEEQYAVLIRDGTHLVPYEKLFKNLLDDEAKVARVHATLHKQIGEDYGRQKT